MGGFDEHAGIIGDWKPPSPRCRSVSEPLKDEINASGFSFPEPKNSDGSGSERKAGLVERMAARAGYNAPTLNTNMVRETCPPPYLAISPTSFLDSPVFLSNSLVQPSPTTGKFPFAPNDNGGSSMFSDTSDKNKDKLFEGASFAFKPVPASTSDHESKVDMSWQAFPSRGGQSENRPLPFGSGNGSVEQSRPQDDNGNNVNSNNGGASEDGYNWRKYGQKQVKGSEYPRSYYKCTHPNCPVKKKVERSHEGHITEIIYKGAHSHPKPPPPPSRGAGDNVWTTINDGNPSSTQFESSDVVDGSSTFSNEEEEDLATHGSVSLGYDIDGGEGDESESKRRKVEAYATTATDVSGGSRGLREPRVVVQTTSEVDILDDGYRWRKYGQKVVKGNPNPRSYYKCTSTGCTVRKHVERASHDLKSVITTYEGKHNHDVPAARNSSHVNSQPQIHRPELPSQGRFDYGLQQAGPLSHGYGYGTGVGQMGMPGFGGHHHNQFIGQMNGMGLMLPKGEPKVEPVSEPGLNLANANASSLYHNQMNILPLGPHM